MFQKVLRIADRVVFSMLDAIMVLIAALLFVLMNYAVFARFILNSSVAWSEELPAHLLAALTFIGAAYLTRTNEHLGFDSVLIALPELFQRIVLIIILALMAWFAAALAYYGAIAAWSFGARELISVNLPIYLFRGTVPVGGAIIFLICLVRIIGLVSGRLSSDDIKTISDA
jgi:TRAP-type transport system small permease protein